jgi:hypothetical protein
VRQHIPRKDVMGFPTVYLLLPTAKMYVIDVYIMYYGLGIDANILKQISSGAIQDSNTDEYLYVVVERRKSRSKQEWEPLYDLSFSIPTKLTWEEWKGFIRTMLRVDIDALEDPRGHTAETFEGFRDGLIGFQFKIHYEGSRSKIRLYCQKDDPTVARRVLSEDNLRHLPLHHENRFNGQTTKVPQFPRRSSKNVCIPDPQETQQRLSKEISTPPTTRGNVQTKPCEPATNIIAQQIFE